MNKQTFIKNVLIINVSKEFLLITQYFKKYWLIIFIAIVIGGILGFVYHSTFVQYKADVFYSNIISNSDADFTRGSWEGINKEFTNTKFSDDFKNVQDKDLIYKLQDPSWLYRNIKPVYDNGDRLKGVTITAEGKTSDDAINHARLIQNRIKYLVSYIEGKKITQKFLTQSQNLANKPAANLYLINSNLQVLKKELHRLTLIRKSEGEHATHNNILISSNLLDDDKFMTYIPIDMKITALKIQIVGLEDEISEFSASKIDTSELLPYFFTSASVKNSENYLLSAIENLRLELKKKPVCNDFRIVNSGCALLRKFEIQLIGLQENLNNNLLIQEKIQSVAIKSWYGYSAISIILILIFSIFSIFIHIYIKHINLK